MTTWMAVFPGLGKGNVRLHTGGMGNVRPKSDSKSNTYVLIRKLPV